MKVTISKELHYFEKMELLETNVMHVGLYISAAKKKAVIKCEPIDYFRVLIEEIHLNFYLELKTGKYLK